MLFVHVEPYRLTVISAETSLALLAMLLLSQYNQLRLAQVFLEWIQTFSVLKYNLIIYNYTDSYKFSKLHVPTIIYCRNELFTDKQ